MKKFRESNIDPAVAMAIQDKIDYCFAKGPIDFARNRSAKRPGRFFCCPWARVYVTIRSCAIGGQVLNALEQFIFVVAAET